MSNEPGPRPVVVASLAMFVLTAMDGFIKAMSAHFPTPMIVVLRFGLGSIIALALYVAMGAPRITREALTIGAIRGLVSVATAGFFFAALGLLPLVEAIALTFLSPIIIALLGRVFLGEAISSGIVGGILLGTMGLVVMLAESLFVAAHSEQNLIGVASALIATLTYAIAQIMLRARATRDPLPVLVLLQNAFPALYMAPIAAFMWVTPSAEQLVMFTAMAALGTLGHVLLTWAMARADAARIGVTEYTGLVWAALIGYFGFGEVPTLATLVGAFLIVAGALSVGWAKKPAAA